ncbi:PLDc N-terminal domain-containing protein [Hymenobacter latericus]|uniref:PLDc N-terminal domain-containing protein n=1 Tax=Hymenobacter sp. YIM 151858-1 TaxID=2987688 RepID=UPI002226C1EA|nr:PLDc N-terminal domain-containing protein [Hymenobacter sp. YIM 151858-1]UYZ58396.1 PLDc N-terminal domain-containing protein [Hymenobacter sp. YIM 151858-1]
MNFLAKYSLRPAVTACLMSLLTLSMSACSRRTSSGSLTIFGGIILILDILALIDILRQPWSLGKKILWVAIIWFLPLLGLLLYYLLAGRGKS